MVLLLLFRFSSTTTHICLTSDYYGFLLYYDCVAQNIQSSYIGAVFGWFSLDFLCLARQIKKCVVDRSKYRKMKTELGVTALSGPTLISTLPSRLNLISCLFAPSPSSATEIQCTLIQPLLAFHPGRICTTEQLIN